MKTVNLRTVPLADIVDLEIYAVADLFPMLSSDVRKEDGKNDTLTLSELADSIIENGLQEPIVLFTPLGSSDTLLLDGRNRRAACLMAIDALGVSDKEFTVQVEDFVGSENEADEFVLALNIDRRDLTPGQRAFVAIGYWDFRDHGGDRKSESDSSSKLNLTVHDLAQRFRVSTGYIVEARKISQTITDDRKAAEDASQEAERQRAIVAEKKMEIEAAKAVEDDAKAAAAVDAVNRASLAAENAAERAAEKAILATTKATRVDKVKSGSASMGSLVKEVKTDTSDTDPTVRFRTKLNSSMSSIKQAISELAEASGRGEDDYNFVGRKLNELVAHFRAEFGQED